MSVDKDAVIRAVFAEEEKTQICNDILHSLPDWFANEEAIADYSVKVRPMPFYAVDVGGQTVGFAAVKIHNSDTAEICVMGIRNENHRQRLGTGLIREAERFCKASGHRFLTVKTLDGSVDFKPYEKTRKFYEQAGFIPLEVFPLYWDADNPCLFLAKYLG